MNYFLLVTKHDLWLIFTFFALLLVLCFGELKKFKSRSKVSGEQTSENALDSVRLWLNSITSSSTAQIYVLLNSSLVVLSLQALSQGAIFLVICNAILLLGDVKIGKYIFPSQFSNIFSTYQTFFTNLHLLRVELQSARKIAQCDRISK